MLQRIKERVRGEGLRATPARIAILNVMHAADAPLTHAEVCSKVSSMGIDEATVFRNLNGLAEVGLLRKLELGDHVWRFELVEPTQAQGDAHPHFLCVDCGSVTCLGEVKLTNRSREVTEAIGVVTEILVRGHCNDCR
jgi:Fur family transcriptional regulator, ferric uptake regulator